MAYSVSAIINIAKQEVGYLEKASNSQLDDKTANAGSNNYTKYARDLYAAGYYNGNKNGYAWCDVFVDWVFYKAFGKDGQAIQCQTGDLGAGCEFSARYYKNAGRLYSTPKIGDQIFFKNSSGTPCHTGLVVNVTSSKVYTIEGNTSSAAGVVANGGCVAEKSYAIDYSRIYGYGRPKYDNYDVSTSTTTNSTTSTGGTCEVTLPILKKGSKSGYVKTLQILLNKYDSAKLVEDGDFGTNTYNAVVNYQKSRGLSADGEVGSKTWGSILK